MNTVNLTIDGIKVAVPASYTILEAAREAHINIPTLCYLKDINQIGACRICLVEVKGARSFQAACVSPVGEGMEVYTNTPALRNARRINLELLLSNHNRECTSCVRSENCELQRLCREYNVKEYPYDGKKTKAQLDEVGPSIVRDNSKCISCRRCVAACNNVQKIGAIGAVNRGFMNNDQRYAGYCDALEEAGITPNPENLITNLFPFKAERGIALGRQLAAQRAITGVCVSGDQRYGLAYAGGAG